MLSRPNEYDASDNTDGTYLPIEDVELIIETNGKGFAKDARKVMHFVRRVEATMRAYRNQIQGLQRDVIEARASRERAGMSSTLNPLDAAQYLTPAQKKSLFEGAWRDELGRLEAAQAEAHKAKMASQSELNRIKFAAASVLESKDLTPSARARLQELLRTLPASAGDHMAQPPAAAPQWGAPGAGAPTAPSQPAQPAQPGPAQPPSSGQPETPTAPDDGDDLTSLFS